MTTPKYFLLAGLLGLGTLGLIWFWSQDVPNTEQMSDTQALSSEEARTLNPDVFPLYSRAVWDNPVIEGGTVSISSRRFTEQFTDFDDISSIVTPFVNYYDQKLTAAGWERDISREASGPGANVSYYVKDGRFIIIGFESEFLVKHEDAPSECPCDTRVFITSGIDN